MPDPMERRFAEAIASGKTLVDAAPEYCSAFRALLEDITARVAASGEPTLPEVRAELSEANAVLPTLDAGGAALYRRINRPHPNITFKRHLQGLIDFRKEYHGKLWVEVMLVRDLNDTGQALIELAAVLERMQPDEVHILKPTRLPVETWVQPSDEKGLLRACAIPCARMN